MNILLAYHEFLIYLRLHKGRSRHTQEQYAFHIWRFILYISPDLQKFSEKHSLSWENFLPPKSLSDGKKWRSPVYTIIEKISLPNIENIKKNDFDEWRLSLSDAGLSTKTTNAHIITIRSWLKYLKKENINCIDPTMLDLIKTEDREVTFLTSEEIDEFFGTIDTENIRGIRDFAICECIYSTGLRISELTNLNRDDVNLESMEFAVRGK